MRKWILTTCVLALLTLIPVSMMGCGDSVNVDAFKAQIATLASQRDNLEKVVQEAEAQKANITALLELLPEGEAKEKALVLNQKLDLVITSANERLPALLTAIDELNERAQKAETAWDLADAGVQSSAPLIPAPWGQLVLLGWSVVSTVRAVMNRRAGKQIAASVEGKLNLTEPGIKADIRSQQGATAQRIVDEAQGKAFSLPL